MVQKLSGRAVFKTLTMGPPASPAPSPWIGSGSEALSDRGCETEKRTAQQPDDCDQPGQEKKSHLCRGDLYGRVTSALCCFDQQGRFDGLKQPEAFVAFFFSPNCHESAAYLAPCAKTYQALSHLRC